jgi:methyl-accepting chemotaxis protein
MCVDSTKVTNLTEGWKKIGSDIELSGAAVQIVKVDNKYYESTDTAHENEITDDTVVTNGAGHYLKLTIAQGDVVYVPTSNLVDLSNYYTKSEIDTKIAGINQFKYEVAAELPTASASTLYILYLIPAQADSAEQQNVYDQYITVQQGETYTWEKIGDTRVDFSDINVRLDNIDSSIVNINSSINNINSSINTINTSINNINSSINTINTSINDINSSINTINTSIGYINTSINDIYTLAKGSINDISTRTNTTLATLIENSSDNKSDIVLTLAVADGSTAGTGLATNTYVDQKFEWVSIDGEQTVQ